MPRTHQDRDCASDHDRESVVRRLRLFPTRAIDIHVTVCTLEAPEQYRSHRLAAKLKVDEYWQDLDHICCTSIRTYLTPSEDVVDRLRALLKKAGLPAIHFHDLHHSAGILLLTERFQEMLGHRNSYMTIDNVCSQHAKGCDQPLEYCSGEKEKDGKHEVHVL